MSAKRRFDEYRLGEMYFRRFVLSKKCRSSVVSLLIREREGDRDRQTDRQTDRDRQRQADRQTGRQAGRHTDTETERDRRSDVRKQMTLLAHDLDPDLDLTPLTLVNGGGPRQLLSCPLFDDGQTLFVARLCCPELRKGDWVSSTGPPPLWDVSCSLFWSDGCSLGLPL